MEAEGAWPGPGARGFCPSRPAFPRSCFLFLRSDVRGVGLGRGAADSQLPVGRGERAGSGDGGPLLPAVVIPLAAAGGAPRPAPGPAWERGPSGGQTDLSSWPRDLGGSFCFRLPGLGRAHCSADELQLVRACSPQRGLSQLAWQGVGRWKGGTGYSPEMLPAEAEPAAAQIPMGNRSPFSVCAVWGEYTVQIKTRVGGG